MFDLIFIIPLIFLGAPIYFYLWSSDPSNKGHSIGKIFLAIWTIELIVIGVYALSFSWYRESGSLGILDYFIIACATSPIFMVLLLANWHRFSSNNSDIKPSQPSSLEPSTSKKLGGSKSLTLIFYILLLLSTLIHVIMPIISVPALIIVITLYIKRNKYKNSWLTSHVKWLNVTFFVSLFITILAITIIGGYQTVGSSLLIISSLWLGYRSIKGLYYFKKMETIGTW